MDGESVMLKYLDQIVRCENDTDLTKVMEIAPPILAANAHSLLAAMEIAFRNACTRFRERLGSRSAGKDDMYVAFHKVARNIIRTMVSSPEKDKFSISVKVGKTNRICKRCVHGYKGSLVSRCGSLKVVRPIMHFRPKDVADMHSILRHISGRTYDIMRGRIARRLADQMSNCYSKYIRAWNSMGTTILKFDESRMELGFRHFDDGRVWLKIWTVHGKAITFEMRNLNSWLVDGKLVEPFEEVFGMFRVTEWKEVLRHPTRWLTLDNYSFLCDEYIHVEEIPVEEIGGDGEIRALRVWMHGMGIHEGTYVFFRRGRDGRYKFVNANIREAKNVIRRRELLGRLSETTASIQ